MDDRSSSELEHQSARIGVLCVHGIGSQLPGDTLGRFLEGLQLAYPGLMVTAVGPTEGRAALGDRVVRVYEAYWADLLEGERVAGTFSRFELNSLAWFPWLNKRTRLYPKPYTLRVLAWTIILTPIALFAAVLNFFISGIYYLFTRSSLSALLDRTAGDVTNYAASIGRAVPSAKIEAVGGEVIGRFWAAYRKAEADGCNELHVVAHSLGTVIAYHALSSYGDECVNADATPPPPRVRGLYTIGSPLEKIRFIWPTLIRERPLGTRATAAAAGLIWHNFHDRLDLVSGRLCHAENWGLVKNHGLFGRGGLGRAHVIYQADPVFLRIVGERLFGAPSRASLSISRRIGLALISLGESGLVILALLLPLLTAGILAVVAAVVFATVITIGGYLDAESAQFAIELGWDASFRISLWLTGTFFVLLIVVGPVALGRFAAASSHYAFRFHQLPETPTSPSEADATSQSLWSRSQALRLAAKTALVLAIAAAGYVIAALFWRDQTGDAPPWGPNQSIGRRIGVGVGLFFYSLLADLLIALFLAALYFASRAIGRYRRWADNTIQPPASPS